MAVLLGIGGSSAGGGSLKAIICWDGESTPVPANIPAGVVVTYNGTSYTGTLAASSATKKNSYLVHNGTSGLNVYDEYVTVVSIGRSTYSWELLGPTEVRLAKYVAVDKAQSFTEAEKKQGCDNIGAAYASSVKSSLDATLVDNVEYRLGSLSTLALALPASGVYGICVIFTSSVSFTPTITGTYGGETPFATTANKTSEYLFTWNGTKWVLSILEY